jgi:hypothetical protein
MKTLLLEIIVNIVVIISQSGILERKTTCQKRLDWARNVTTLL